MYALHRILQNTGRKTTAASYKQSKQKVVIKPITVGVEKVDELSRSELENRLPRTEAIDGATKFISQQP